MSNLFYKYLTERLLNYLKKNFRKGDRYYFQLDNEDELMNFHNYLENFENAEEFSYKHPKGTEYKSFTIDINGIRLVVAATLNGVTPDFMVTLRNCVAEGKDEFQDTGILFVTNVPLDSLSGGSSNLRKEGMPFNIKNLSAYLEEDIRGSKLKKGEKEAVRFYLDKKLEGYYDTPSLWDLEDILVILENKKIEKELYPKLDLFPDEALELYPMTKKEMEARIEENNRSYEKIRHALTYSEEELEKFLDDEGIRKIQNLRQDDAWRFMDYSIVRDSEERLLDLKKEKIEYLGCSLEDSDIIYWEKKEKDKRISLVIFNSEGKSKIPVTFEFDKRVDSELVKLTPKSTDKEIRRNRVTLNLEPQSGVTNFYKFIYDFGKKTTVNIAILHTGNAYLEDIKTCSYVRMTSQRNGEIVIQVPENEIYLGRKDAAEKSIFDLEENQTINFSLDRIKIDSSEVIDEEISLKLKLSEENEIPLRLKIEQKRNFPWDGTQIYKQKREADESFIYDSEKKRVTQGTGTYILKNEFIKFLEMEQEILDQEINLDLPEELKNAYKDILEYYREMELLPSLAVFDDLLRELYINFLEIFNREIEGIEENRALVNQDKKTDLWNIGLLEKEEEMYLTSLHPLNMAYQLFLYEKAGDEILPSSVQERLRSSTLIPFIIKGRDLYRSLEIKCAPEWKLCRKMSESSVGQTHGFLSRIVKDKLIDFYSHFKYLFPAGSRAPLRVKVINIENDYEIARGFISFILWQIEQLGIRNLIPLDIYIHKSSEIPSELEKLSKVSTFAELAEKFDLTEDIAEIDGGDILRAIRNSIRYYTRKDSFEYTHLSFYKMLSNSNPAKNLMEEIPQSIGLGGLVSGSSSLSSTSDYRTGFGAKGMAIEDNQLLRTAKNLNELICNMENQGKNSYQKNHVLVTTTSLNENREMNEILNTSFWVNFIEPNVNLDYFYKNNGDLAVIHYSDQYTSSSQYDSITVSSRTNQYQKLITQYLESIPLLSAMDYDREKVSRDIIKTFNSFNGEWLLRIVGDRSNLNFEREKISIIAAIKNLLVNLEMPDIIWIPVSLEEILRVAGSVGLRREDGMFSAKNLGSTGKHSDDLLLVGIEDGSELKLHYYPVEVKIGNAVSSIKRKAEEQIERTINLLKENLKKEDEEGKFNFKNSFYRNFFIQVIISAAEKLAVNDVILDRNQLERLELIKEKLQRDEYTIDYSLEEQIGAGGIVLFQRDTPYSSRSEMDYSRNIMLYEYKENKAYRSIIKNIDELKKEEC